MVRKAGAMAEFVRSGVVVIDGLFASTELEDITATLDELEFESQDLGRGVAGRRRRAATDSPELAGLIWDRLAPHLPSIGAFFSGGPGTPRLDPPVDDWEAVACNVASADECPRTGFRSLRRTVEGTRRANRPARSARI